MAPYLFYAEALHTVANGALLWQMHKHRTYTGASVRSQLLLLLAATMCTYASGWMLIAARCGLVCVLSLNLLTMLSLHPAHGAIQRVEDDLPMWLPIGLCACAAVGVKCFIAPNLDVYMLFWSYVSVAAIVPQVRTLCKTAAGPPPTMLYYMPIMCSYAAVNAAHHVRKWLVSQSAVSGDDAAAAPYTWRSAKSHKLAASVAQCLLVAAAALAYGALVRTAHRRERAAALSAQAAEVGGNRPDTAPPPPPAAYKGSGARCSLVKDM